MASHRHACQPYKWGDFFFAYRCLSYEQGGNKLVEDLKFGGFGVGVTCRF